MREVLVDRYPRCVGSGRRHNDGRKPVEQGGSGVAHMEITGGRRGEADAGWGVFHRKAPTQKLEIM